MKKQEVINRKQFLSKLGLGTGAIMATYCLGSLSSCDDEDDDYIGGEVNFTFFIKLFQFKQCFKLI